MTHLRLKLYESRGDVSGVEFYHLACSCGWRGLNVTDRQIAVEDWKRHARRAEEAA